MPRAMTRAASSLLILCAIFYPETCLASEIFSSQFWYDWGLDGLHPRTWYKSFEGASPLLKFLQWDDRCDDGGLYLMSPRGSIVSKPGPLIMDARGNFVWSDDKCGEVTDFKAQTFQGKEYLTFWAGTNGIGHRFGHGVYYMLDETYQVYRTIEPVGEGLSGDLHDFFITKDGTALMTVYNSVPGDLSALGGPAEGWILDSLFQEVDIESGKLLFEWKASDHIPVTETMRPFLGSDLGGSPQSGFDYFHINSVDKNADGNYIVSGRHTHTIMCISPVGKTLWIMGGRNNMFKDLSHGRATDFTWQHHARHHGNNTISIFDNAKSETTGGTYIGDYSRGMVIQVDTASMTATLLKEYSDPQHPKLAQSQGSTQIMEDTGNVLLSFGFLPTFTEFDAQGQVLCDVRIAPWLVFKSGMVTSYRTFKSKKWVGKPAYPPSTFLRPSEERMYVSWSGATEVNKWVLQGATWTGVRDDQYTDLDEQFKDGFESSFEIRSDMPDYLRVLAVDADGNTLGHSDVVNKRVGNAPSTSKRDIQITVGVCVGIVVVLLLRFRRRIVQACGARSIHKMLGFRYVQRRWKDWRGANDHELKPLYEDY